MDLEALLKELHAERQFLQLMIEALEAAARSPSRRLMETLSEDLAPFRRLPPRKRYQLEWLARKALKAEAAGLRRSRTARRSPPVA